MKFNSLPQLLDYFKDEKTCVKYFEQMVWREKPVCPHCKAEKPYVLKSGGYKCSNSKCYKKFTVKVGTVLESSKIPLRKWYIAIFLISTHKKGISSVQLATDLGVTQKTAWFMLHRIREMMKSKSPEKLGSATGIIEIDEAVIGGSERNRHQKKRHNPRTGLAMDGTPYNHKQIVVGMIERGGNVILKHVPTVIGTWSLVLDKVVKGSTIITDSAPMYKILGRDYNHHSINHNIEQYVKGNVHTNTVENYWSVLKRTLGSTYIHVSGKHLQAYLNESSARFNTRNEDVKQKFDKIVSNAHGSCLYKVLTAKDY